MSSDDGDHEAAFLLDLLAARLSHDRRIVFGNTVIHNPDAIDAMQVTSNGTTLIVRGVKMTFERVDNQTVEQVAQKVAHQCPSAAIKLLHPTTFIDVICVDLCTIDDRTLLIYMKGGERLSIEYPTIDDAAHIFDLF